MLNKQWFKNKIDSFLGNDPCNKMKAIDGSLIFEPDVLIGFVSGNDHIFDDYKEVIGSFHLTPIEAYTKYCEKNNLSLSSGENLTVVAFILPINELTKKENFKYSRDWPSKRWAHTRLFGEKCNKKLWDYLLEELKNTFGINGVAPAKETYLFKINKVHENGVWASTWSHRHAAYAAGLGSFGLSDGFLNKKGIAMRCGSIIIDHELPSDAQDRPSDPYKYCTNCGTCIKRCPVGAITFNDGHDKQKCFEKLQSTIPYINENYHIPIYACGLCQTGVPCENYIPENKK